MQFAIANSSANPQGVLVLTIRKGKVRSKSKTKPNCSNVMEIGTKRDLLQMQRQSQTQSVYARHWPIYIDYNNNSMWIGRENRRCGDSGSWRTASVSNLRDMVTVIWTMLYVRT